MTFIAKSEISHRLFNLFQNTRAETIAATKGLYLEDFNLQAADFASPTKWHLAHTTWFFEQFVLLPYVASYKIYDPSFSFLFNSYYNGVGPRVKRNSRHLISRPGLDEIYVYQKYVDDAVIKYFEFFPDQAISSLELGIHHEKQHQELILTDIKFNSFSSPLPFAVREKSEFEKQIPNKLWSNHPAGIYEIGHNAVSEFSFDNETPAHKVYLHAFSISNELVTAAEYINFIEDGGYKDHCLWHSDAWSEIQEKDLLKPLYFRQGKTSWEQFTLAGWQEIIGDEPVAHISLYEASAYAAWAGFRLPTEFEWEVANLENKNILWEHTSSAYSPYPGFQKEAGAIGEYNGKFMMNQYVLRGGSLATPKEHLRKTYRNFFYPHESWQYTGIRLAKSL